MVKLRIGDFRDGLLVTLTGVQQETPKRYDGRRVFQQVLGRDTRNLLGAGTSPPRFYGLVVQLVRTIDC